LNDLLLLALPFPLGSTFLSTAVWDDPEKEAKVWLEKIVSADRQRTKYQEMAAEELITFEELRERLGGLEETRKTAQSELEAISLRQAIGGTATRRGRSRASIRDHRPGGPRGYSSRREAPNLQDP